MKVLGWYVVDGLNHAIDVKDQDTAKLLAAEWNNLAMRHDPFHPFRAVLLAEIDESEIPTIGE